MNIRQATESAQQAGRPRASERAASHRLAHRVGVGVLTALMAVGYSVYGLFQYYTFKPTSYDLLIFSEAVQSYAHFHDGISPIKGIHNGFGPNFSVLGDHFSPIIAALAPMYWFHNGADNLLVAQAVLFALAIPPLWVFTRRAFGGGPKATAAAYLVAVAYGLSFEIAAAASFDFHEVAFAPVLTAIALERFQAGRLRSALIALAFLLLVKEDMGLFVAGIGIYLALARPRVVRKQWLVGIGLVVVGVAWTAFATYVLIPSFGGHSDYYWAYGTLGKNVPQVVGHIVAHPRSSLQMLFAPRVKLDTMLWLAGALCFLPLLSPIALAVIPLLVERMLNSKFGNWWGTDYQYNAYLVVALVCAAVDGAARLDRWLTRAWRYLTNRSGRPAPAASVPAATVPADAVPAQTAAAGASPAGDATASGPTGGTTATAPAAPLRGAGTFALACAVAMCGVAVYTVSLPRFALAAALKPSFYHRTALDRAAAAADAVVPSGVTVQATNYLGPQLASKDRVLLWDGDGKHPPLYPPWVVANVRQLQFTFSSVRQQRQSVQHLENSGYRVVFRRDGYVVLHRVGQKTAAKTAQGGAG
jgi:uncharacterized membrane protein